MTAMSIVVSLVVVVAAAKAGGFAAATLRQPRVLGELGAGLLVGNLALLGYSGLDYLKTDIVADVLSRIAVILLLFQVGLESTVGEMKNVGLVACLVAACGVIGSLTAGWAVAHALLPSASAYAQVFVGASITATSVGVTARVLREIGQARSASARVILGAAVVDDVIGLLVLAVMGASGAIAVVLLKAGVFLVGGLAIGMFMSPRLLSLASKSMAGVLLATALAFCFAMAWLAGVFGLAPIVGAFVAGLIIEEWHYQDFIDRRERTLDDLVQPLASWLVPVFFVVMGIRTDLAGVAKPGVLALAGALTLAAVLGKQLCALGVAGARAAGVDRLAVGLGMMPRGEVTLIFANLGMTTIVAGRPLIDGDVFLAIVITVIATTLATPPALAWRFGRVSTVLRRS